MRPAAHDLRGELADDGEEFLALDLDALQADEFLDEGIQFLHHDQALNLGGELLDQPGRERPDHAQFEEGGLRENLTRVQVAGA